MLGNLKSDESNQLHYYLYSHITIPNSIYYISFLLNGEL